MRSHSSIILLLIENITLTFFPVTYDDDNEETSTSISTSFDDVSMEFENNNDVTSEILNQEHRNSIRKRLSRYQNNSDM